MSHIVKSYREAGVAHLELALLLPIVVLLFVGTIEANRYINSSDEAAFFSQLMSQKGFTDCANSHVLSDQRPEAITECLETYIRVVLLPNIQQDFPTAQLVVSVYYYNPVTDAIELRGYRRISEPQSRCSDGIDNDNDGLIDAALDPECVASTFMDYEDITQLSPSRYTEARVSSELFNLIKQTRTLVIAETIVPYKTLFPGLSFVTSSLGSAHYAVSIT